NAPRAVALSLLTARGSKTRREIVRRRTLPRTSSGDLAAPMIFRPIPLAAVHDGAQGCDSVPQLRKTQVERCKAEAHHIGGAEVADDPSRDQSLHDRPAVGMRVGDLAAAAARTFDRREREAATSQLLLHQGLEDRVLLQCFRI